MSGTYHEQVLCKMEAGEEVLLNQQQQQGGSRLGSWLTRVIFNRSTSVGLPHSSSTHDVDALPEQLARDFHSVVLDDVVTSPGTLTSVSETQLQNGAKQCYKQNSRNFGQEVSEDEELELGPQTPTISVDMGTQTGVKDTQKTGERLKSVTVTKTVQPKSRLESIILEQSLFTVYKRLFVISFMLNLVGLILAASGYFSYAKSRAALYSVANVLIVVLVRNEVFLRIVFWLAVQLFGYRWIPLRIKTMTTAFLQSVGGIHSGCGMAAIMWLLYAVAGTLRNRNENSLANFCLAWVVLTLLAFSSLAAFPLFRHTHHNFFERVHRFAGWTTLVAVWVFIILSDAWDPATQLYQVSITSLIQKQSLWYTAATTFMIILPWLFVRKVAVEIVVPPTKLNSLLNFKGGVAPGIFGRISPSPFSEWHAFGIISDGQDKHTILAGAVGDFTKGLVEDPPTHIWVRTFHFSGLPYLTNMYSKAILVATGSGICVFMSFLLQRTRAEVHVIWIAKNIQASYGDEIWEVVEKTPSERFTVIDTAVFGRPKTKEMVVTKAKEWQAEVVIVTSNPSGTKEIVSGCNGEGIPAFGPIWDS